MIEQKKRNCRTQKRPIILVGEDDADDSEFLTDIFQK